MKKQTSNSSKEMTVGQLIETEKFQEEFYKNHINELKQKKQEKISDK